MQTDVLDPTTDPIAEPDDHDPPIDELNDTNDEPDDDEPDDERDEQLVLDLGPQGLRKERAVLQAVEILVPRGKLKAGQRVRFAGEAIVDKASFAFRTGELKWALVADEAEIVDE